jgi:hypothetical protein
MADLAMPGPHGLRGDRALVHLDQRRNQVAGEKRGPPEVMGQGRNG